VTDRRAPGGRDEEFGADACWSGPVEEERRKVSGRMRICVRMERCWAVALGT